VIHKELTTWESLEAVRQHTRSVTFEGSLSFYKAPRAVGRGYGLKTLEIVSSTGWQYNVKGALLWHQGDVSFQF